MNSRTVLTLAGVSVIIAGVWMYLRSRTPAGTEPTPDPADPAGLIKFDAPDVQVDMPMLAPFELEATVLEKVAIGARQLASTVSSWFHPNGEKFRPLFDAAERANGIPHGLLFRLAYQESRFREDIITGKVRSSAGALGIVQIIPKWHPSIDKGDAAADEKAALDPNRAIPYAAKYLALLKKQFGSWELALAAYNFGPGNVSKTPQAKWPLETKNYVAQITADINVRSS